MLYEVITEFITEGKYYKKRNTYFISYKESAVTGMDGTTTTLKVEDNSVTLMRFGHVSSHMVFEQSCRHVSGYETQFGIFTVGVFSNKVDININDDGGKIIVDYLVELDNMNTGKSYFEIDIKEAFKEGNSFMVGGMKN